MQVSEELTVEHGLRAMHDMATQQGRTALSEQQLAMAVQLAQNVADLLAQGSRLTMQVYYS